MNIDSKLVDKIQKLLRLSESPNEHEAELALMKAKALAVENDIDLASINTKEESEDYIQNDISFGKRNPVTTNHASRICINHFNVKIIYYGSRNWGKKVIFIGKTTDVKIAMFVFEFVLNKFMQLWHAYREVKQVSTKSRASYFQGLYDGLNQKLTQAKKQAEINKFETLDLTVKDEIKNNYSLMVISKEKELEKASYKFFPNQKKSQGAKLNLNDYDAFSDGFQDGKSIEINKGLTGQVSGVLDN